MNILLAFDKFKDSMSADQACNAADLGVRKALGESITLTRAPLTDGGEGFCRILTNAAGGNIKYYKVAGLIGKKINAPIGWTHLECIPTNARKFFNVSKGKLAIIEMASVVGLEQVPLGQRNPKYFSTKGVGELIRIASEGGADAILIGIGGSATSDLGLGALEELGLKFCHKIRITPANWENIKQVRGEIRLEIPQISIACDVNNPLLGPNGAASVYGQQKGLPPEEITTFDKATARMAAKICGFFDQPKAVMEVPGSGAAGGIGFGLNAACGAKYVPGFELVTAWLSLEEKIQNANLILTGEGKFDLSSLSGKGPFALLAAAQSNNTTIILLAGHVEEAATELVEKKFPGTKIFSITPKGTSLPNALKLAPKFMTQKVADVLA